MTVYDGDHYVTGLPYKFTDCVTVGLDGIQARKGKDGVVKNNCFA